MPAFGSSVLTPQRFNSRVLKIHWMSLKRQTDNSIFSPRTNTTWCPTGRDLQLSFTPMWATTAPPPTSTLRPTLTNFLGTELFASQTAAGSLLTTGLPVFKVRVYSYIPWTLVVKVSAWEATSCVHNMFRCQLHLSSTLASWTHAMGRQPEIWYNLLSIYSFSP